ncbi:sugar nucleotide-binding protein [Glycomyces sp. YM15]|uniref:SDR family oxidoreductase n=1 Tax=Glycomyces sp. YM15 TaxID=2800446 RepID=UPI0019656F4E|nr:sugar nucleotide-binding protein [Glycomyces sp. YM15]
MRLLIIGATGYLGREIHRQAEAAGHEVIGTKFSSKGDGLRQLDIRDWEAVAELEDDRIAPDAVINAACNQSDWATTAFGPANLAAYTSAIGARFVHISSDAIFNGDLEVYDESSAPSPNTPYGAAKAAAEVAVAAGHPEAVIARTFWILGDGRSGFESFVRDLARGEADGVLFDDDVRCPVHVADLAAAVLELCSTGIVGVLNVAGSDAVSRYELGCLLAERDGLDLGNLPKASKSSYGAKGITVRLDTRRANALLAAKLRGGREFAASNPT